ncbi:threonyl-tRNA synthetase [Thermodesulfovibrio aggregans]|uniref:Threonine--tRNA ligase n=1 Tax=Thermodesulfovibrio aggregans TaxID=86166 RepID=A0A0U9IA38_9BACT|nr:threonine--tRNA ligase [Thermodesulfovibrio aggregans]GAQ94966.1 threonyl-tRNA synthetase [Thermodesulfovibrio aggregans]
MSIKVKIKDSIFELEPEEVKKLIKENQAIAIKVNGQLKDLLFLSFLNGDEEIEIITADNEEGLEILRHSTAHIMAHAVKDLFPEVKVTIGPAIEDGFYYDFDKDEPFTEEDLQKIEKRMQEIIRAKNPFTRKEISKQEAIELFESLGESYKVEILSEIEDEKVSIYEEGGFIDLCRGPHVPHTGVVKAFKLLSVAGAYWRGDEKNKMLQRIYGIAFPTKEQLESYLKFLEEVKKRDHRRLGKQLRLFEISEEIGPGLIIWLPNGALIRKIIEDFWKDEHIKAGYQLLYTPHIAKLELWQKSGHLDFYRENMYSPMEIDEVAYQLKPMNCPFHIQVYKSELRSYRDLPLRFAELGTVYRYERSGVLHGLLRVRGFTQDDAHIFCTEEQLEEEIQKVLDFTVFILSTFGFDNYEIYISTRPEKYVGSLENWEKATGALEQALKKQNLPYQIDPGEGVFYGPKIDIKIKDVLNRAWQCSTIQVDFNIPERFDITYRGKDGKEHRPIMIHRALMGSLERFMGVLIEHYAGAFPLWLAPVQVEVMSISEKHTDYAKQIYDKLVQKGFRVKLNIENEKIGYKIRQATLNKIPYMVIVGEKEMESGRLTVRLQEGKNLELISIDEFLQQLFERIQQRK